MSFLWPTALVSLVAVPALVAAYVGLLRRRARRTADLAAQALVGTAASARIGRRRHVPFGLFIVALTVLLVAFARPAMTLNLPHREGTVILAFDVSNSMAADDLKPTRMEAAKAAARRFVQRQPSSIKVGVVAFSDGGLVTQSPTDVRGDVLAAIDRLTPAGGTSVGAGIFTSLNAIAGKPIALSEAAAAGNLDNVDIGFFGSAAVVLLSDGENTAPLDPLEVSKLASVAGVRIFTIGLGSPEGTVVKVNGYSVATKLDQDMLGQIASVTNGTYSLAENEAALNKVYDSVDLKFVSHGAKTEVTGVLTGASALLLLAGGALSLVWFGRVV